MGPGKDVTGAKTMSLPDSKERLPELRGYRHAKESSAHHKTGNTLEARVGNSSAVEEGPSISGQVWLVLTPRPSELLRESAQNKNKNAPQSSAAEYA